MQSDLHKIIVSPQPLTSDHVKVFVYQILRGVKYLHAANILHRDIKPGNLLVNSNCILKICDFGLARIWDSRDSVNMTHEVVTQYYRAPELLMGARRYSTAVDVWSIGCIFAELLGRRILFQAQGPIEQLNLIIDLLGTPQPNEMKSACEGARNHVLRSPYRPPNMMKLYALSPQASHEAVHLLSQLLVFDPEKRISIDDALAHPYLEEGRMRFHSCMCSCCYTAANSSRVFTTAFDPVHQEPFDSKWEKELSRMSMFDLRDRMYKFVTERQPLYGVPLCINPHSAAYKSFASSSVAQPSELPPSPNAWD
jgi:nemo like kinase